MAAHFARHGYATFYAGKYLNQYNGGGAAAAAATPPGWSHWYGLHGNSRYTNFTLSENGRARHYANGEYLTDRLADLVCEFVGNRTAAGGPFLAMVAPPAAHAPFEPARRHRERFGDVELLRTAAFNRPSDGELGEFD